MAGHRKTYIHFKDCPDFYYISYDNNKRYNFFKVAKNGRAYKSKENFENFELALEKLKSIVGLEISVIQ